MNLSATYKYAIHYMPNHYPEYNINYNVMIWKWFNAPDIEHSGYVFAGYGHLQQTIEDCYNYINDHHAKYGDKGTAPYIEICGKIDNPAIKGVIINANIWGGNKRVKLTRWSEIRKLGFRPSQRAFSTISRDEAQQAYAEHPDLLPHLPSPIYSDVPVLCFMTDRDNWWFTWETMEEINKLS